MRQIRKLAGRELDPDTSDLELLQRFVQQHEETAFTTLVERHGPMVLGVCRRVLQDEHRAEDAFQATFLMLVHKSSALVQRGFMAGWLHTVAFHMALQMRAREARQRQRTQEVGDMIQAEFPAPPPADPDLRPVLDDELARLPEKYRAPLILCYLEGKTNDEAACLLGWTRGTVAGRLSRARDLLRGRLARRGLALSTAALATSLPSACATAAVPAALRNETASLALRLITHQDVPASLLDMIQGMTRSLRWARVRAWAVVLVLFAVVGSSVAWLSQRTAAQPASEPETVYLADLEAARLDVQRAEFFHKGAALAGVHSERSLGLHPPTSGVSMVTYKLEGKYRLLETAVGLRDNPNQRRTPIYFAVLGDGKELWKSGPVVAPGELQECRVDIRGVDELRLEVRCPGPSVYAWAAWSEPRVSK
jgi:RNA polymerase sigma factor (sigma-70 family)